MPFDAKDAEDSGEYCKECQGMGGHNCNYGYAWSWNHAEEKVSESDKDEEIVKRKPGRPAKAGKKGKGRA